MVDVEALVDTTTTDCKASSTTSLPPAMAESKMADEVGMGFWGMTEEEVVVLAVVMGGDGVESE